MPRYVALLRGINVGGKNKLPMSAARDLFQAADCTDVETYIQSGNVVFSASAAAMERVPSRFTAAVERTFGFRVPMVIRSSTQLRKVAAGNPFAKTRCDPASLYVMFLLDKPARALIDQLDPRRSPGDDMHVAGSEIYLQLRTGAAKTKLTNAYFDSTLATVSTSRNWRTVLALCQMTAGAQ
jgi:uncharacterized protein (DUF1697 family)